MGRVGEIAGPGAGKGGLGGEIVGPGERIGAPDVSHVRMKRLRDCGGVAAAGRKAELLARAIAQGLPVPDGWVVLPDEPMEHVLAALPQALAALGGRRFAVRSSAQVEDVPGRTAAGLFHTATDVPAEQVGPAIAAVRASGATAQVQAYLGPLGQGADVAVLIQPQVEAARLGVLYVGEDVFAEERPADEPEWGAVQRRALTEADAGPRGLLGLSRALLALLDGTGPALVEYAVAQRSAAPCSDGTVWLLQGRRLGVEGARPQASPWQLTGADARLTFVQDREHNPDPLSPAQAGLVALVEPEAQQAGFTQRVVQGYLYWAPLAPAAAADPQVAEPLAPAALWAHFHDVVLREADALLRPLEATLAQLPATPDPRWAAAAAGPLALAPALLVYRRIYRRYVGEISPAVRRARRALEQLLLSALGEDLSHHGALLFAIDSQTLRRAESLYRLGQARPDDDGALGAHLSRYGAYAPSWDVALPCDDEDPARVRTLAQALAAGPDPRVRAARARELHHQAVAALQARLSPGAREDLTRCLPAARAAMAVAEDDDALFARAQRLVRRALLCRGAALVQAGHLQHPEQVFFLPWPLPTLLSAADPGPDLAAAAEHARRFVRAQDRALAPPQIAQGQPVWPPPPDATVLRGHGIAGPDPTPVRAPARVLRSLSTPPHPDQVRGAVLVLPALLPSWAPLLTGAAALVTDVGGVLSHGATLAREAGLPAVVGVASATRRLRDGQPVVVDAREGLVYWGSAGAVHAGNTPGRVNGR